MAKQDIEDDLLEFTARQQPAAEQKEYITAGILDKYQFKMDSKVETNAEDNFTVKHLQEIHQEITKSITEDLENKAKNEDLLFELDQEFKTAVWEKITEKYEEYKSKVETDWQIRSTKNAEKVMAACLKSYKDALLDSKWDSFSKMQKMQPEKMIEIEKHFENNCLNKDPEFLAPLVTKLKAEMESVYLRESESIKLKFEQQEIVLKQQTIKAMQFYEAEMKKHFKQHSFVTPADFRLIDKKLILQALDKFGKNLPKSIREKLRQNLVPLFEKYNEKNTMNTPGNVAIGIDLGTTYSCAAVYHKGEVKIIPSAFGNNTIPSFVAFTKSGEKIGDTAKNQAHENPTETVFDAKRLIGRKFNENEVQNDIKLWPFQVVPEAGGSNNKPVIMINGIPREPEVISAKILKHIRELAEKFLKGIKVNKAVITVPAYFNDGQRQATMDSAAIAGLEVIQLLSEPTAAAMAYYLHQERTGLVEAAGRNILVYDLGGGTFDVSVLSITDGNIQVRGVNGNTHLGGEDFDENLVKFCIQKFAQETGINLSGQPQQRAYVQPQLAPYGHQYFGASKTKLYTTPPQTAVGVARQLRRLKTECEKRKKDLSAADSTTIVLDAIINGKDLNISVTRKEFEHLNLSLFQETITIVQKALADAKLRPGQIDEIVLVGGSTRIPKIQEMLKEYFGGKQLCVHLNPDEAVAYGAAILAAKLNGLKEQRLQKISLEDVTPLSIGIEIKDGTNSIIIPRNTNVPAKFTNEYRTSENNQTEVTISIYEGEEKIAVGNHLLGEFKLTGIPPNRKGVEKAHVTMEINQQGILHVTAKCLSAGATSDIVIKEEKGRLTKEDIDRLCLEMA